MVNRAKKTSSQLSADVTNLPARPKSKGDSSSNAGLLLTEAGNNVVRVEGNEFEWGNELVKWQSVIEGIADEVWLCNKTGKMSLMNLPSVTKMGLTEFSDKTIEEVLEQVEIMYLNGRPRPANKAPLLRAMATGKIIRGQEIMKHLPTGNIRYRQYSCAPVRDKVGKIVGAVAVVRDITGEKLAERALIRQANLLELTHDAIFVWDFDGGITFWNKGAEKIYGYSKEEAIGKNNHQLLATKHPKGVAYIRSKLKSTGKWEGEIFHRTKDGKTIVIESKHVLVKERGRPAYVLETNRDITYRKEIEQRRNDFIALVSHELKTPLTSVKLYVQITKHILAKKHDGEHDKMIVKIERQLDRLTKLVQDMLTLVRMQKGKLEYSMKEIDLDAMIRETIEDMQLIYPKYRIINRLASNARVVGDYDRLNEVLVNIINNAVRYVEDKREILVGSELNGKCVKVWVQDYGMGIPKEAQKKIFTRFFRVESQVIQTYPGLGVGLYISSQIIKSHGGQIGVTSEVGSGSTFYFTLPVPSIQAS